MPLCFLNDLLPLLGYVLSRFLNDRQPPVQESRPATEIKRKRDQAVDNYTRMTKEVTLCKVLSEEDLEELHHKNMQKVLQEFCSYLARGPRNDIPVELSKLSERISSEKRLLEMHNEVKIEEEKQDLKKKELRRRMNEAIEMVKMQLQEKYGLDTFYAPPEEIHSFFDRKFKEALEWFLNEPSTASVSLYREEIERRCKKELNNYKKLNQIKQNGGLLQMTNENRDTLTKASTELVKNLELSAGFLAELTRSDVIQQEHVEQLENKTVPRGDRVLKLIHIIQRRGYSAYFNLCEAMEKSGQAYLLPLEQYRLQ